MRHLDLEFLVSAAPDTVLLNVAMAVGPLRNVTATRGAPGAMAITESWWPIRVYVVAILLFPIGLLALLVRDRATLTVSAFAVDGGTRVQVTGRGHEAVCDPVLAALSNQPHYIA